MLAPQPTYYLSPDERDQEIFEATVPQQHFLRRVKAVIDFERLRPILAEAYSHDQGRPAIEPLLLLKLEFLQYQYNHSDRQVIEHARSNMAYRYFLELALHSPLPHHTLLTYFRQRLGVERHQQIFDAVVAQAREKGLVKDRLRLKDATHVVANIAIPTTLALVAQTRDRLLQALEAWAPEEVRAQRQRAEQMRQSTADLSGEERLLQRVVHLRELVAWAQVLCASEAFVAALPAQQRPLQDALALACRVLDDPDDDDSPGRVRSLHDPEARSGKHGSFYVGYLLDVSMDADSQIITALNVLPGGSNEGADAETLLRREEEAHGNDVQAVSIDSAGYQGPLLHTLTDPDQLNVEVFVPPRQPVSKRAFQPEDFQFSEDHTKLICPGGQMTPNRRRHATGWQFAFTRSVCAHCSLRCQCMPDLPQKNGRVVYKNDFEADLRAARAKAKTPAYEQVRREHPGIERKIAELVCRHGARRARYRRQLGVMLQQLATAWVVNIKRLVNLIVPPPGIAGGLLRAAMVGPS
jgi:transposase